ncbi:hypothetical protein [Streptomyces sp. NPDC058695]
MSQGSPCFSWGRFQCLVRLIAYVAFPAIDRIESALPLPALMERP